MFSQEEDMTPEEPEQRTHYSLEMLTGTKSFISGDMFWSDGAETELFGHDDHRYIWRRKT